MVLTKEVLGTTITKFNGTVQQMMYLPSKKGEYRIIAYDKNRKITYLASASPTSGNYSGYAATKGSTILTTEIGPSSATTDLTAGNIDTTDPAIDTVNTGKTVNGTDSKLTRQNVLEMIQTITNGDIYIHKDGTTDFKLAGAGTDRTSTIVLVDGLNGELTGDFGYFTDNSKTVKRVIVKGKGTGVLNAVIGAAQDPSYVSTDKIRQFEIPFLQSYSTCNNVASNLLAELNKVTQYAKFQLTDILTVDYDVFDTVRLKAKLINNNVDVNLKIYSIDVVVNVNQQEHESVILELLNFNRAIFAPLIIPTMAAGAAQKNIALSSQSTQAQDNIGSAGGSSIIQNSANAVTETIVGISEVSIGSVVIGSTSIAGVFLNMDFKIIGRKFGSGIGILFIRVTDGTNFYPVGGTFMWVQYSANEESITYKTCSILIPVDASGKTLTIKAQVADGEVVIENATYIETIGVHIH